MEKTALIIAIAALIVAIGAVLFLIFGGSLAETMLVRYSAGNNTVTSQPDTTKKAASNTTGTTASGGAKLPQLEQLQQQLPGQCKYTTQIHEGRNGKQSCADIGKTCSFAVSLVLSYSYASTDGTCSGSIQDDDREPWPMACTDIVRSGEESHCYPDNLPQPAEPQKGDRSYESMGVAICCD